MSTILVTGAGSGIGLDAVKRMVAAKHTVIAVIEQAEQKSDLPEGVTVLLGDLTDATFRQTVIKQAEEVDVLVCNAGVGESGPLIEQPEANIRRVFETNVFATILLAQPFGVAMAKRGHGRLVFTTSMAGFVTVPNLGAYSATKRALEAMADALRRELFAFGVTVACVEPGLIYTGFNERMAATKFDWLKPTSLFAKSMDAWRTNDAGLPSRSAEVSTAGKTLFEAATSAKPNPQNPTPAWPYRPARFLLNLFPARIVDRVLRKSSM